MFHPGKVINMLQGKDVINSDESIQAVVEMWDKNILTFSVHPKLVDKVKEGDTVLVDYRPINERIPVPRHVIIKVLKGKKADEVWKTYKKFHAEKQVKATSSNTPQYFG
ncbi:hypothetical protein C4573_04285 [Candidatus Woesearchaeota archaeon]|nr:MAG: hypothetical protein C4573_04285 [Candidatus Woesearchaeota archaeon]